MSYDQKNHSVIDRQINAACLAICLGLIVKIYSMLLADFKLQHFRMLSREINVNVREFLRHLRIETYLKDAHANRKEAHVW